ncbi:MAG: transferase [Marmoricola sp.]
MTDPTCRGCGALRTADDTVLDLGLVPAADDFPAPGDPLLDALHPLAMWLCRACGLAQLVEDDTTGNEPLAVEPQALRDQAAEAVALVHDWEPVRALAHRGAVELSHPGDDSARNNPTVVEFGSPHGGSWLPLFRARGWTVAHGSPGDVVVDTFGLMHEPDQLTAIAARAERLTDDGVLLLLFHSLATIVEQHQWSSLRHGHYAYYSATALVPLLATVGLAPVAAWHFELYGGTVLLAASRHGGPEPSVVELLLREAALGLTDAETLRSLQRAADTESRALATALRSGPWYAYGAASRAVAVLHRAGARPDQLVAVADAAPGKQGRAMPGTRIPIISPETLLAADPERVWLLLPDLLREVTAALPELAGRWQTSIEETP